MDIRRKTLDLAMDLLTPRNVEEVTALLRKVMGFYFKMKKIRKKNIFFFFLELFEHHTLYYSI